MTISWYPGHMNKARKELTKLMASVHVVVEVLDARMPNASSNPMLATLRGETPCIKVLNKADLAVGHVTESWQQYFNSQSGVRCLLNGKDQPLQTETLLQAANALIRGTDRANSRSRQLVIVGIPNVGKSTLLNHIAQRKLAKTGNEPAVTKAQQRVKLGDGWYLIDTPGLLWPKLEDQKAAGLLACAGTIRNTAISTEDVGWYAAELLMEEYRGVLVDRFGFGPEIDAPEKLLDYIGSSRGGIGKGGHSNWHKSAELLLNDFRSGKLGKFSLEQPPS